jgi:Zn-dependent protease with chaperone function|tara:strand:- start:257 stop:874 length:618 start_codon:yes stop_codon:yes gene_type:complete
MNILLLRILEILFVPYIYKEALWTIAPLVFALVMVQMYFGKYKTELLGWNTAFSNNISLIWVTAIILRYLSEVQGLYNSWNNPDLRGYLILALALGVFTIILSILTFNHLIPKKLDFILSSSLPTNVIAYFVLVIVIGKIPLDETTFLATLLIFAFLSIVFHFYRKSITPPKSEIPTLKKHEKEKKKEIGKIKRKIQKILPIKKK